MAQSVINFLLPKLTDLISQEYTLLQGLESEVQYIIDELGSMRAFLRIAEAKIDAGLLDDEHKLWFKQVMEVAYDTEDIVDHFLLRFSHEKGSGFHGCVRHMYSSVKNLPARHEITSQIMGIKNRVEQISSRHQRYKSNEGTSESRISEHPIRGHGLLLEEADLVGIDGPKNEVNSLIPNNDSNMKVISVFGMGGLGKTTLVKRVFETPKVKNTFSIHAWLTISQTFIIMDALKNLIKQLCKDVNQPIPVEVDSMNVDELRAFVREFLKGKRYIIVLDDLWESNHWESIKLIFPDDKCGSCILITTRNQEIAKMCCPKFHDTVYTMQPLSPDESWTLFCKKTFKEGNCPAHLEDISRAILKKCRGLPLGIAVIGGLLALKNNNKNEWEMILNSLHAGELESNGKLDPIRKIILLSYNDLPYYLKPCLLYMAIFPEDTIVYAYELWYLWIAEGFIKVRQGMTTMEVAQEYLNELINRSLIQVADTDSIGMVSVCRVHDLIYDMILSKGKEYNILSIASAPYTKYPKDVRRLVVHYESSFPKDNVPLLHLRSLILRTNMKSDSPVIDSSLSQLLKGSSNLLKVLSLENSNLNIIPNEVFNLLNLTYLNLEFTNVTNIPNSIKNLQNLEYLNLYFTRVKVLPTGIIMLKKLFYLMVYGFNTRCFKAPPGIGKMISLHYLKYLEVDSVKVIREIGKLTQLRQLSITNIKSAYESELCSSLQNLTNLQVLTIEAIENQSHEILNLEYSFSSTHYQYLRQLDVTGRLVKIPSWVSSCHELTYLNLTNSLLSEDPLGSLEGLPNLIELTLENAYMGDSLNFKAGGFRKLKYLVLIDLSGLKSVTLEKGTMPCLEHLNIIRCELLKELPDDIYLRKLKELNWDKEDIGSS